MQSEFDKFWAENVSLFNSCKSVSRLAAALAWNAAMTLASETATAVCETEIAHEFLEHKAKL